MNLNARRLIRAMLDRPAPLPEKAGIYAIVNRENGRAYIGSSASIKKRVHHHRSLLRSGKHSNQLLREEWAQHGEDAFVFGVLHLCRITFKHHLWNIERELTRQMLGPDCYNWGAAGQRCRYMGHPAVPGYGASQLPVRQGEKWA